MRLALNLPRSRRCGGGAGILRRSSCPPRTRTVRTNSNKHNHPLAPAQKLRSKPILRTNYYARSRPTPTQSLYGIQISYVCGVSLKASGNSITIGPLRSCHLRSVSTATRSNVPSPDLFRIFTSSTFPFLPTCSSYFPSPCLLVQGGFMGYVGFGPLRTVSFPKKGTSISPMSLLCITTNWVVTAPLIVYVIGTLTFQTVPGANRHRRNAASAASSRIEEPVLIPILASFT